jgi:hypothetical protein
LGSSVAVKEFLAVSILPVGNHTPETGPLAFTGMAAQTKAATSAKVMTTVELERSNVGSFLPIRIAA